MSHKNPYLYFGLMVVLSFVSMYVLMYAMVNVVGNALPNWNQFYMAGLMTSPMIVLEMLFMGMMYGNKKMNLAIIGGGIVLLILFWIGIRQQVGISDEQFLRSMIPHHAGAILMCNKAKLEDPELIALCANITSGQQDEIDFMKTKLNNLKSGAVSTVANPVTVTSGENPEPGSIHDMPVEPAAAVARKELATKLGVAEKSIVIMQITDTTWNDSCLGLGGPAESCLQLLVPGFTIELLAQGKTYIYRTDKSGETVRAET